MWKGLGRFQGWPFELDILCHFRPPPPPPQATGSHAMISFFLSATGCLSRLLGQLAHGHIRCPTCKGDTLIPGLSNDISKLAKNFGVLEILEGIEDGVKVTSGTTDPVSSAFG